MYMSLTRKQQLLQQRSNWGIFGCTCYFSHGIACCAPLNGSFVPSNAKKKNNQPNEMFTALYLKKTFKRTHRLRRIFFFWFQNTSLIYKRNNNLFKLYCNKYFSFLINTLSLKCRPYVAVTVIIPFGILSELQSYHDYVTLMNLNNSWTSYSIKGDIARKLYQLSNCWEWVRLEYMNVGQQRCTVYYIFTCFRGC